VNLWIVPAEAGEHVEIQVQTERLPDWVLEKLKEIREERIKQLQGSPDDPSCLKTRQYLATLTQRLISASGLKDFHKQVGIAEIQTELFPTSNRFDGPSLFMNASYMLVYMATFRHSKSDDVAAAFVAHELAHYFLLHDAKDLMILGRGFQPTRPGTLWDAVSYDGKTKQLNQARYQHELEADRLSVDLLVNLDMDPYATIDARVLTEGLLRDRVLQDDALPTTDERLRAIHRRLDEKGYTQKTHVLSKELQAVHDELRPLFKR
jgi:hypothetical protein